MKKSRQAKHDQRERERHQAAHLEGLVRLGRNDEAVRYLIKEYGANKEEAALTVERMAGAIGNERRAMVGHDKIIVTIVMSLAALWVLASVLLQRVVPMGEGAMYLYALRWLILASVGIVLVISCQKGKWRQQWARLIVGMVFVATAVNPLRAVAADLAQGPISTPDITVSIKQHYGDQRVELIPIGEKSSRRYGKMVSKKSLEGIKGNHVQLVYYTHTGVVLSVGASQNIS